MGGRGERRKIPSGTIVNEEIPPEEQQPGPSRECNNLAKSSNDESSDEEDDNTTCKTCKIRWIELMEKCEEWVQWDICDEYICTKSYGDRNISTDDDFFYRICIGP